MLLITQKKLMDAERELSVAEQRNAALQAESREQDYASRVRLALCEHQMAELRRQVDAARAEVRAMSRVMLQRQTEHEAVVQALNAQLEAAASARPATAAAPPLAGAAANDRLATLQSQVARQEQQIQTQAREMAEISTLLSQSETHARHMEHAFESARLWLKTMTRILLETPTGAARPEVDLDHCARRLIEAGIVDGAWYLETNRDVAENRIDPARHFLEYGVQEDRLPRPISGSAPPKPAAELPPDLPAPARAAATRRQAEAAAAAGGRSA